MADAASHPLPAELRQAAGVWIDAANRDGRWQWVAYVGPSHSWGYSQLTRDAYWASREALQQWLADRFGTPARTLRDLLTLEEEARDVLALLLAEGEAATLWDAIEAARAAAAAAAPDLPEAFAARGINRAHPVSCRYVDRVRKARATLAKVQRLNRQARAAAAAGQDSSATPQYLYAFAGPEYFDGATTPAHYRRWRILRETRQFLFVDPAYGCLSYGDESWQERPTYCDGLGRGSVRVPRNLQEISGAARRRLRAPWASTLHRSQDALPPLTASGPAAAVGVGRSADLDALGIAAGVEITTRSLKAAFRRKARTAHPDGGGSAEAFRLLTDAYERLSAAIAGGRR